MWRIFKPADRAEIRDAARPESLQVNLRPEIDRHLTKYAKAEGISRDVAANELLRVGLGLA